MTGPYRTAAPCPPVSPREKSDALCSLLDALDGIGPITAAELQSEVLRLRLRHEREAEQRRSLTCTYSVPVPRWKA